MTENHLFGQAELPQSDDQPAFKWVAECLYRHTASGTYYALVKRNGKQIRKSLKTSDRQLADRRLAEFRAKATRVSNPTKDRGTTFMELAKDWFDVAKTRLKPSSALGMEVCLRQLNKHFGIKPVRSITTADCHEWEKKRGHKISASSFNHDRTALVAVLNHGVREGLLMENPALTIARRKLPKNKITIPTKDQFNLMVKTIRAAGPLAIRLRIWTAKWRSRSSPCWRISSGLPYWHLACISGAV
jgi:hypothetical protein